MPNVGVNPDFGSVDEGPTDSLKLRNVTVLK